MEHLGFPAGSGLKGLRFGFQMRVGFRKLPSWDLGSGSCVCSLEFQGFKAFAQDLGFR